MRLRNFLLSSEFCHQSRLLKQLSNSFYHQLEAFQIIFKFDYSFINFPANMGSYGTSWTLQNIRRLFSQRTNYFIALPGIDRGHGVIKFLNNSIAIPCCGN